MNKCRKSMGKFFCSLIILLFAVGCACPNEAVSTTVNKTEDVNTIKTLGYSTKTSVYSKTDQNDIPTSPPSFSIPKTISTTLPETLTPVITPSPTLHEEIRYYPDAERLNYFEFLSIESKPIQGLLIFPCFMLGVIEDNHVLCHWLGTNSFYTMRIENEIESQLRPNTNFMVFGKYDNMLTTLTFKDGSTENVPRFVGVDVDYELDEYLAELKKEDIIKKVEEGSAFNENGIAVSSLFPSSMTGSYVKLPCRNKELAEFGVVCYWVSADTKFVGDTTYTSVLDVELDEDIFVYGFVSNQINCYSKPDDLQRYCVSRIILTSYKKK